MVKTTKILLIAASALLLYSSLAWGNPQCQAVFDSFVYEKHLWQNSLSILPNQRPPLIERSLTQLERRAQNMVLASELNTLVRQWVELFNLPHSQVYFVESPLLNADTGVLRLMARGPLFQRVAELGESLSRSEQDSLLDSFRAHQWLNPVRDGSPAIRDALWSFLWGLRLRWHPQETLTNLVGSLTRSLDQPSRESFQILNRWDPEITRAFTKIPPELKTQLREILRLSLQSEDKDILVQRLFVHFHQAELNSLVQGLQSGAEHNNLTRSQVVSLVDQFFLNLGFSQAGSSGRGGYSFTEVIKLIEPGQQWVRSTSRLRREANHLFFFGSFPNGRAHWLRAQNRLAWQKSDLDVSFSHFAQLAERGLRGESWFFTGERDSSLYRQTVRLEETLSQALALYDVRPGRLLAPMTSITPYQLTQMRRPEPGMAYPTLASPLVLEIGRHQSWLHLHSLPSGAIEPLTVRIPLPNE